MAKTITVTLTVRQAQSLRLAASAALYDGEDDKTDAAGVRAMAKLEDAIERATGREFAQRLTGRKGE